MEPGKYKLDKLIELINASNVLHITYSSKTFSPDATVTIAQPNLTIREILNEIQKASPIDYELKDDYIILKKKKTNTKFKISGRVYNSATNEPLIGASVYIKGSNLGEMSNNNGLYSLSLPSDSYTLVISYVGFKTEEKAIELNGDINIDIPLIITENQIEEIKVTQQRDFWGNMNTGRNISSIDMKKIELLNTNNASDLLQASMPGVWSSANFRRHLATIKKSASGA